MKRICVCVLIVMMLLTGCSDKVYETVSDAAVMLTAQPAEIQLQLPPQAAVATIGDGTGNRIYICDGYTVAVQTLSGGDLDATVRNVTGFGADDLTLLQTQVGAYTRYECAFSCAGETQQVGRAVILDDHVYHYAVSVLADADTSDTQPWQSVLQSVQLSTAP